MTLPRVGYVLKVFPRLSQTFVLNELLAHQRAGAAVEVFSLRCPPASAHLDAWKALRTPIVHLGAEGEEPPEAELSDRLAREVKRRGIAHLHAHFANIATAVARAAATAAGIPYSFTAHARDVFDAKVVPADLAAKLAGAAAVATVSRFNVEFLAERYGARAQLIRNGLPLPEFEYEAPAERAPLILGVGRLVEKKGFRHLVGACARLRDRGADFRCEIIGDGPEEQALRALVAEMGLADRVHLVGARAPEDVRAAMRRAALLAAPCVVARDGDRDGLPTVLLEAMALGTPCIATDVTGIPEVVAHDVTGLLVRQADSVALASACARLLHQPELRVRLAGAARGLIEAHYDVDRNAEALRGLFAMPARRRPALRFAFRVSSRRGLGHLVRSLNVARAIRAREPESDVLLSVRGEPPFPTGDRRIRCAPIGAGEAEGAIPRSVAEFDPDVLVDDTLLPGDALCPGSSARRAYVMRRCADAEQRAILDHPALAAMDLVLVPHTQEEFGLELPDAIAARAVFTGPIVRSPDPEEIGRLRARYGIAPASFVLVSTAGGGGFAADRARFFGVVRAAHLRLVRRLGGRLRHVVVLGPRSEATFEAVDAAMTVATAEPAMASLIALADAVISAGGYNSVNEIRQARRPAFFLPGVRSHDDQAERVRALENRGLGLALVDDPEAVAAERIASACADPAALAAIRARYAGDDFVPGNDAAAAHLVALAREGRRR